MYAALPFMKLLPWTDFPRARPARARRREVMAMANPDPEIGWPACAQGQAMRLTRLPDNSVESLQPIPGGPC